MPLNKSMSFEEKIKKRFFSKFSRKGDDDCWIWTGSRLPKGYGSFSVNRIRKNAHRVSWTIHYGEIPSGMLVCHKCDNPPCVNPYHLFIGTNQDNVNDKMNKGRQRWTTVKGAQHYKAILTEKDVLKIRKMYSTKKYSSFQLAELFQVSRGCIDGVVYNKTWKHLRSKS